MSPLRDGDPMTRTQLMKFNPLWNDSDRAVLVEDLETFGGAEFVFSQAGWNRSVRVLDADGTELMAVAPGTIYYAGGRSRPGSVSSESRAGHVFRTSRWGKGGGSRGDASLRRWNHTVASYVLDELQHAKDDDVDTGVASLTTSPINTTKEVGVLVRLTATPEGLALVQRLVSDVMQSKGLTSAAPEWIAG